MESKLCPKKRGRSPLRIQPSRRAKKNDSDDKNKENISIQHKETARKKVVNQKMKKDSKAEPVRVELLKSASSKSDSSKQKKNEKISKG